MIMNNKGMGSFFLVFWLLCVSSLHAQDIRYIDITNPFARKIPIAVPDFKLLTEDATGKIPEKSPSGILMETLEFTGYFKLTDRGAFLEEPKEKGIQTENINFKNWRTIGSELLVTGGMSIEGEIVKFDLRLFDTFKEQLIVGKRYKGSLIDQHKMLRKFCGEILEKLMGSKGMFESKIAFVSNGTGHKELYVCEFDGSNPVKITEHKSITLFPNWSSDGKYLAYTSYVKGTPDLFTRNMKTGKILKLLPQPGLQISPSWEPGENSMAAALSFSGDQEIYLVTGSGKITKQLTNDKGIDVEPTWSPDGKKIAFVSRRAGSPQIFVMEVATQRTERLTFEGKYNTQPSWSPKGDRIVYTGLEGSQSNVFVIDAKGGSPPVQLTLNTGNNEAPSWSPDGSLIVFSSNRTGPSRIFVMTSFGTDQRMLLTMPGEQTDPHWSPDGIIE